MDIKRNNDINVSHSADTIIEPGDIIVAMGNVEQLNKLYSLVR